MTLVETRQVAVLLGKVLKGPGSSPPCLACVQVGSKLDPHPTSGKGDREEEHTLPPFIKDNCGSGTRHFCSCSISSYSCDPLGDTVLFWRPVPATASVFREDGELRGGSREQLVIFVTKGERHKGSIVSIPKELASPNNSPIVPFPRSAKPRRRERP